ncbi:uncharacterized protein LOC117786993 [Drosophila innubila]|uniref:uncharacterized protein LOC117786993 n=1 Tax=Drosophila innubila TaxID=198719 RepID=UPI00148E4EFC|nr:uncharacterized protein LOC117786993 [Drosophila innubila]
MTTVYDQMTNNARTFVSVRGKVKTIIESVQTNCDHDFVEFFDKVPHKDSLYTFRVAKLAPSFTISIIMRAVKTQRVMFKINLEGCPFLNNPIMNKALGSSYRKVLIFVCGKVKVVLESVDTDCDHDFVEYFHPVPNQETLHTFRVVRLAPSFTLNIVMRAIKSQRIMYKINNLDGCQFVNNPFMNKVLASTYNTLIVNNSFFKCPIQPKVYYLKNVGKAFMMPTFHPLGQYQLTMGLHMSQSRAPFVMQIVWKYKVLNIR